MKMRRFARMGFGWGLAVGLLLESLVVIAGGEARADEAKGACSRRA